MSRFSVRRQQVAIFALGVAVAAFSYRVDGWWLDSGAGALRTMLGLFVIASLLTLLRTGPLWGACAALWLGAFVGTAGVLFRVGPGTIWPIVLILAAGILALAVFAGGAVGYGVNRLRR
jgi:hypothetical protein